MPFHGEALFTLLRVLGQSAVGKAKTPDGTVFIDYVNYPATVKRPETEMLNDYGNNLTGLNGCVRPAEPNAGNFEHLPLMQRLHRLVECCRTPAQVDTATEPGMAGG
jgi:hypothetical protein